MENVPEKEIDNLLKKSFTLTDEEIKKLKAMMTNSEDNFCIGIFWVLGFILKQSGLADYYHSLTKGGE